MSDHPPPDPDQHRLTVGTRVRLCPSPNWFTQFAPLAENKRLGTVTALGNHGSVSVEFDTVRRGARPITGVFGVSSLIVVDAPKIEQLEVLL